MEEENLIVSLTTLEEDEKRRSGLEIISLEKNIIGCREKNFGEILDYMLDPREDALNPAYNKEQRDLSYRIKIWKERAIETQYTVSPNIFDLMYVKPDSSLSKPLQLQEYLSDYPDIVKQKTRKTDFGEELRYDGLDLVALYLPCCE